MDDRMGNPINRNAFVDATHEGLPSCIKNNNIHLCDSCKYSYPSCPSSKFDVVFGDSVGHDNICACNKYQPRYDEEWRKLHYESSYSQGFLEGVRMCEQAQPEITDRQAIEQLQESGWMQNHDKQMYEMGLREQLADDSDSYDALLPSAQPEIVTCKECVHYFDDFFHCDRVTWYNGKDDFCSKGKRRTDGGRD